MKIASQIILFFISIGAPLFGIAQDVKTVALDSTSLSLMKYYVHNGQNADAKNLGLELMKQDSTNEQILSQLASIFEQEYNLPKAIKYYSALLKTDTLNALYHKQNAIVHKKAGLKTDAYWYFGRAYELNPKDMTVVSELVDLLLENDQEILADSIIDQALLLDSTNIKMLLTKARSAYKQKNYAGVTVSLEKTLDRIDLPETYTKLLGFSYLQIDSVDKAIFRLEQLIHSEQKEFIHYYLAIAYDKKGDQESSLFHYEKAIDKSISENINIYYGEAAKILETKGEKGSAIKFYKEAYRYEPKPKYLYQIATLSDLYYKDKSIAIRYYDRYLDLENVHPPFAEYALKRSTYLKEIIFQKELSN